MPLAGQGAEPRRLADGSGVEIVFDTGPFVSNAIDAAGFSCSARDPSGGFFVIVEADGTFAPFLIHLNEDSQGADGVTRIPTTPAFEAAVSDARFPFAYCSMAVGSDGTIFIQTFQELWRLDPP